MAGLLILALSEGLLEFLFQIKSNGFGIRLMFDTQEKARDSLAPTLSLVIELRKSMDIEIDIVSTNWIGHQSHSCITRKVAGVFIPNRHAWGLVPHTRINYGFSFRDGEVGGIKIYSIWETV